MSSSVSSSCFFFPASPRVTDGASYRGSRWCLSLVDGRPVITGERVEEGRVDGEGRQQERKLTRGGNCRARVGRRVLPSSPGWQERAVEANLSSPRLSLPLLLFSSCVRMTVGKASPSSRLTVSFLSSPHSLSL